MPKPKPSPKRMNWKREAKRLAGELGATQALWDNSSNLCLSLERRAKSAEQRIAELEAERLRLKAKVEKLSTCVICKHPLDVSIMAAICEDAKCVHAYADKLRPTLWQRFKAWRRG